MQHTESKKKKTPSKEVLAEIKAELQELYPKLKRLKVKAYYTNGRVRAQASLGCRRIYVRGNVSNVAERFCAQYDERVESAFG